MNVKFWNGKSWTSATLSSDRNVVMIKGRPYSIDQDGFVRLGLYKFRLFSANYQGTPVGAYERVA